MNGIQFKSSKVSHLLLFTVLVLTGCGDNTTEPPVVKAPVPIDTSPEPFSFASTTEQALDVLITSNTITVSGINSATPISITGGEYSIDGGEFSSLTTTISNQQTLFVRLRSASNYSTTNDLTITIGDISETFSATTHSSFTKLANELSTDISARYSVVSQPVRGRVIVSTDLTKLTYQPMASFDYLSAEETAQETIEVTLIGADETVRELNFTITGQAEAAVCDDREVITITATEVNQALIHIPEGKCVQLDATKINDGNRWVTWTGESGGGRPILLSTIGVNEENPLITFLPPAAGRYSLSWCPTSGECSTSFYFFSDMPSTTKALDVKLNVHNIHPEEEIFLSVTENNNADTSGYSYRWIIHDWTDKYHKLVDVITTENRLRLPVALTNNNYDIDVIVDDNNFQLEGGFTSVSADLYGKIKLRVDTVGNYQKLGDQVIIRDTNSIKKPPTLIVMIDGDSTRYQWSPITPITVKVLAGAELTFDLSESFDENGDDLSFYINGFLLDATAKRYTVNVTSDAYYNLCVSDGFPWIDEENPCLLFDVLVK